MRTAAIGLIGALTLVGSGCGGHRAAVIVDIKVVKGSATHRLTKSFTLRCQPTGGTLPEAARICRDIAAHRQAMLRPLPPRSVCGGSVYGPYLTVSTRADGQTSKFTGQPYCGWPGGTPLAVYWAASQHDQQALRRAEPMLRCEDDPRLLARPTPWPSVVACTHGFWTARNEGLIRLAETIPELRPLKPRQLFPHDVGVFPCRIVVGGPTTKIAPGQCGVAVRNVWSRPTVSFVEAIRVPGAKPYRHRWVVQVTGGRPRLVSQSRNAVVQLLE